MLGGDRAGIRQSTVDHVLQLLVTTLQEEAERETHGRQ
jgi:hypothetical protein